MKLESEIYDIFEEKATTVNGEKEERIGLQFHIFDDNINLRFLKRIKLLNSKMTITEQHPDIFTYKKKEFLELLDFLRDKVNISKTMTNIEVTQPKNDDKLKTIILDMINGSDYFNTPSEDWYDLLPFITKTLSKMFSVSQDYVNTIVLDMEHKYYQTNFQCSSCENIAAFLTNDGKQFLKDNINLIDNEVKKYFEKIKC